MQKRLPALLLCWVNVVAFIAVTEKSLPAQVITRVARPSFIPPLQVETWPNWLSLAWQNVSPPQSGELEQVGQIRKRIVELLVEAGQTEQAFAAAGTLQGLGRYQAFAHLAAHSDGKPRESAADEAQRGFQFLSARNQEVLVADLMPITTPKGKQAFRDMLSRCVARDERVLALGRAAASSAANEPEIFEECMFELSSDLSGSTALDKRYTALALQAAAEGLRKAGSDHDERWLKIGKMAAGVLDETPINSVDVFAHLASSCFSGGKEMEGKEMLETALEHWRRLGIGTVERMQGMVAITHAAKISKERRLPTNWSEQALNEAVKAKDDWRWDLFVKAGRICHFTGDRERAVGAWREAAKTAGSNPNPLAKLTCRAMIALEAHEAGLKQDEALLRELALVDDEGMNKGGTRAQ